MERESAFGLSELIISCNCNKERRSHGNNLADYSGFIAHRCIAHVALQLGMGLLPKRRFGAYLSHFHHFVAVGKDMINLAHLYLLKGEMK
jgi:hypothetical protein